MVNNLYDGTYLPQRSASLEELSYGYSNIDNDVV